ncbi:MAG TPA: 50S ribosomal protein L44e [Candidatus Altiarchaeales archaeon]|mgnify:CR=1 FL=1|nr:50S ribosomal protein L44e [Candidatus Altiarchaeales archaeon]
MPTFSEKMKLPDKINTNCPKCGKHTQHTVKLSRKGKESPMNRGRRRYDEVKKGYGGSPRCPKKQVYKVGKRNVLLLECSVCKKKRQRVFAARTKKPLEVGK